MDEPRTPGVPPSDRPRRVMMLVHDFPPATGGGTRRPLKFATHLPAMGWWPTVVTLRPEAYARTDPGVLVGLPPEVDIHRTRTLVSPPRMSQGRARVGTRTGTLGPLRNPLANLVREHVLVPDSRVLWWPFAAAAVIRIHRRARVDVLWATGPPFSTNVLGVRLGRRMGIPVVSDLRDPWSHALHLQRADESPRRTQREGALEREVLEGSAATVVTAPSLRTALLDAHPGVDPERVVTITNGYDPDDYAGTTPVGDHGRFRIVYSGKIVEPLYDPRGLLDALDRWVADNPVVLDRVRVDLLGVISDRWENEIRSRPAARILHRHGHVDHGTVRAHQLAADVLVVLQGRLTGPRTIAGKVFEYLHVGAPILGLVDPAGDTARVIRESPGGQVVGVEDGESAVKVLRAAFTRWVAGGSVGREPPSDPGRYDRRTLTARLAEVLDAAASGRPPGPTIG